MLIGYARVSTEDQSLALQHDDLRSAECERIFDDSLSGAKADRPGLARALEQFRDGDSRLAEIRRFLKGRLDTDRTDELSILMCKAGLPI